MLVRWQRRHVECCVFDHVYDFEALNLCIKYNRDFTGLSMYLWSRCIEFKSEIMWIWNNSGHTKLAKWLYTLNILVSKYQHKCSMCLFMWREPAVMRLFEQGCDETIGSYLMRLIVLFQETSNLFWHLYYITRSVPNLSELYCCLLPTQTAACFYSRVRIKIQSLSITLL